MKKEGFMMTDSETKLGLFEISRESVDEWKKWGASLMGESHEEALRTLREEKILQEHVFLLTLDDRHYLAYFSEGKHLPANLERELNKNHKDLLARSVIRKIKGLRMYSLR